MALRSRSSPTSPSTSKAYLYVSDAKVEMHVDGLDPALIDRFDLSNKAGVPGGGFARAERLCAALDAQHRVGSLLDEDTEFFRGELLAAWGFWNRHDEDYADVAYFSGFVDENTFVGLGGSAYHSMERAGDR